MRRPLAAVAFVAACVVGPQSESSAFVAPTSSSTTPPAGGAASTGVLPDNRENQRAGLLGWGLGLTAPMVGVLGGIATDSSPGAGYHLGAALSWEFVPAAMVRFYVSGGSTRGGRASVSYKVSGRREKSRQSADWVTFEGGLGIAYVFRGLLEHWQPFVGLDAGLALHGYEFRFDDRLKPLVAPDDTSEESDGGLFAFETGWTAAVRTGVALALVDWLTAVAELNVGYTPLGRTRITNTIDTPEPATVPEGIWLVRSVFSIRVAL